MLNIYDIYNYIKALNDNLHSDHSNGRYTYEYIFHIFFCIAFIGTKIRGAE